MNLIGDTMFDAGARHDSVTDSEPYDHLDATLEREEELLLRQLQFVQGLLLRKRYARRRRAEDAPRHPSERPEAPDARHG